MIKDKFLKNVGNRTNSRNRITSDESPPLNRGITLAHFHIDGTKQADEEQSDKSERGYINTWAADITNLASKPPGPGLLLVFRSVEINRHNFLKVEWPNMSSGV